MTSHELARKLLAGPDRLVVAVTDNDGPALGIQYGSTVFTGIQTTGPRCGHGTEPVVTLIPDGVCVRLRHEDE